MSELSVSIGRASDSGGRGSNQDAMGDPRPLGLDPATLAQWGELYVVADGMGGMAGGEIASNNTIKTIFEVYYRDNSPDPAQRLRNAFQAAHAQVQQIARSNPSFHDMGSTATAVVIRGSEALVAHVGDSRAYLSRGDQLTPLTQDHTWVAEQVAQGQMTPEDARRHPRRNQVTRGIGGQRPLVVDVYQPFQLVRGDVLLLCSDGLTDVLEDHEIQQELRAYGSATGAQRLVDRANERGREIYESGHDNITALVLEVPGGSRPAVTMPVPVEGEWVRRLPWRQRVIRGGCYGRYRWLGSQLSS